MGRQPTWDQVLRAGVIFLPLVWQADQMDAIREVMLSINEAHQGRCPHRPGGCPGVRTCS